MVKNVLATSTNSSEEINKIILFLEKQLKLETFEEHAIRAVHETLELAFQQYQRNGERRLQIADNRHPTEGIKVW